MTVGPAGDSPKVNDGLRRQVDHDRRMRALDGFLEAYEAEHGEISEEEVHAASRRARARADVVQTLSATEDDLARRRTEELR